ncbi:hypothetical protein AYO47_02035 [Planctomyces sp. SCGC AG-212-M04]|nr:hypothetical protein AYO47_02035 [Planctomyces sp. SCGC AG-212-M04]
MQTENSIALKEWAAVCLALAEGRQSLFVRKGGIAEGSGGFRMEHDEFWLFPTQFHQSPDQLGSAGAELLSRVQTQAPPPGRLRINCYAVVKSVAFVQDEARLAELEGWHVMSAEVVRQRFHYRRPGLFVAAVEVFQGAAVEVSDEPRYAGCHSWVDLSQAISTAKLTAVSPAQPIQKAVELVDSLRT